MSIRWRNITTVVKQVSPRPQWMCSNRIHWMLHSKWNYPTPLPHRSRWHCTICPRCDSFPFKQNSPISLRTALLHGKHLHFDRKPFRFPTEKKINGTFSNCSDVLDSNNILNCLVSDQCGDDEMLHPKSVYTVSESIRYLERLAIGKLLTFFTIPQIKQLALDSSTFLSKLVEHQLGKPYGWAQNLCGLNFTACSQSTATDTHIDYELTQQTVPNIVKRIRSRLQSRLSLYRQILDLEQKNIDNLLLSSATSTADSLSTVRVLCTLVQWTSITWSEYVERNIVTAKFIEGGVVTADHLLYSAIIIRGSAKLECLINISPNFPNACPLWAISLSWNGIHNASTNSDIRVRTTFVHMHYAHTINCNWN